jgi:hypothetical protein
VFVYCKSGPGDGGFIGQYLGTWMSRHSVSRPTIVCCIVLHYVAKFKQIPGRTNRLLPLGMTRTAEKKCSGGRYGYRQQIKFISIALNNFGGYTDILMHRQTDRKMIS